MSMNMGQMPEMQGRKREKHQLESFLLGLAIAATFSVYWVLHPDVWWPIFPVPFAGIVPAVKSVREMAERRISAPKTRKLNERESAIEMERTLLALAPDHNGILTPSLVVLSSNLGLEEAEKALESMASKGHASMSVREDGRIEYEFSEFIR
jgi:hypothetical protein